MHTRTHTNTIARARGHTAKRGGGQISGRKLKGVVGGDLCRALYLFLLYKSSLCVYVERASKRRRHYARRRRDSHYVHYVFDLFALVYNIYECVCVWWSERARREENVTC
jgi:hypothetical protein